MKNGKTKVSRDKILNLQCTYEEKRKFLDTQNQDPQENHEENPQGGLLHKLFSSESQYELKGKISFAVIAFLMIHNSEKNLSSKLSAYGFFMPENNYVGLVKQGIEDSSDRRHSTQQEVIILPLITLIFY